MAAKNDVSGREKGVESAAGEESQRWTAGRKAAIVLDLIKGKVTAADVARQHDLTVTEVESWIDRFVEGGREGLRTVPKDADARFDAERLQLLAKVGELTLHVDALTTRWCFRNSCGLPAPRSGGRAVRDGTGSRCGSGLGSAPRGGHPRACVCGTTTGLSSAAAGTWRRSATTG
ncbi:MAG: hypothetical protein RL689_1951 [Planctomycetota bacterium]|jgi:transposase-like protein